MLKKHSPYKRTLEDYFLDGFIYIFLIALCLITLYPFWYVFCVSVSTPEMIAKAGGFMLWPKGWVFDSYKSVLTSEDFYRSFRNSVLYVVAGTSISMVLTILLAYPLSRKNLIGRKGIMIFVTITMFFSGGMMPMYLLIVNGLKWYGNPLAVLIPSALSTYNMIMLRTNFQQLPAELYESADIDGATEMDILTKIVLPLSVPTLAVISLFYAVGIWNSWFNANLYLPRNREFWPLALYLREILVQGNVNSIQGQMSGAGGTSLPQLAKSLKMTTAILSMLPILVVYPFVQKHFVKGIMVGSIKG